MSQEEESESSDWEDNSNSRPSYYSSRGNKPTKYVSRQHEHQTDFVRLGRAPTLAVVNSLNISRDESPPSDTSPQRRSAAARPSSNSNVMTRSDIVTSQPVAGSNGATAHPPPTTLTMMHPISKSATISPTPPSTTAAHQSSPSHPLTKTSPLHGRAHQQSARVEPLPPNKTSPTSPPHSLSGPSGSAHVASSSPQSGNASESEVSQTLHKLKVKPAT